MKILLVHNYYKSNHVGGEDLVFNQELEGLRKILGEKNVFEYTVSNDNLNKYSLIFKIWYSRKHNNAIKRLIIEKKIDLVHIHNYFPILTGGVFNIGKNNKVKIIHTMHNYRNWCISGIFYKPETGVCEICSKKKYPIHGILNSCYRNSLPSSILAQFAFWFYTKKKFLKKIDRIIVLTEFQRNKLLSLGIDNTKLSIKPNFIEIKKGKINNKIDNQYVFVGRLEKSKGIFVLLKIWRKLPSWYKLVVIGNSEDLENIDEKYHSDNIIFKGKLDQNETRKIIQKSKYLIHPSLCYETFGLTLIEAFSLGTPVIGLNVGTRREMIINEWNGFICKEKDLFKTILL